MLTASKPLIYLRFLKSYNYTPTMQSVLIGSEYPVMDTLLFYFPKSSYCNLFRGVAECYAFSRDTRLVPFSSSFGECQKGKRRVKKTPKPLETLGVLGLAEKEGFEPSIPFWGIHDFQSCALGQLRDFSITVLSVQPGYNTTGNPICQA